MNAVNNKTKFSLSSTKSIWIIAIIAVSLMLGPYHAFFSYAAFLMSLLAVAFLPAEDSLSLMMFLTPFANIFKPTPSSQSFFTYLILFYVLWYFFKKREMKTRVLISFLILSMFLVVQMLASIDVLRTIKFIANLLLIYLAVSENAGKNCKKILLFYVFGVLISSVASAYELIPNLQEYMNIKELDFEGEQIERFKGLYGDPNYYSINVILALCIIIFLNFKKQLSGIATLLLSVLFVIFAGMTQSKSAFLMLVLPLVLLFYAKIKQKRYGTVLVLLGLAAFFLVNLFAGNVELFNVVLVRFDEASDFASLTTGRSDLWASYTDYLLENPLVLLFGSGFGAPLIAGYGAHNTYLDLLYYLGIVGTALVIVYFVSIVKSMLKPEKRNFLNYGAWIGIFIMYSFLSELFYFDWVFHIVIAFLIAQSEMAEASQLNEEKRVVK